MEIRERHVRESIALDTEDSLRLTAAPRWTKLQIGWSVQGSEDEKTPAALTRGRGGW